jgi:hypothetical protein
MKPLSISLVLFGLLALVRPAHQLDLPGAVLGIVILLCAATTFCSSGISSFLKIFVGIFSAETIVFGLAVLAGRAGLWPASYAEYLPQLSVEPRRFDSCRGSRKKNRKEATPNYSAKEGPFKVAFASATPSGLSEVTSRAAAEG